MELDISLNNKFLYDGCSFSAPITVVGNPRKLEENFKLLTENKPTFEITLKGEAPTWAALQIAKLAITKFNTILYRDGDGGLSVVDDVD